MLSLPLIMSAATSTDGLLAAWEDARQVLVVPIGEVLFVNHQETPAIGTRGLGSCSVAMIVSEYGAILAHISPLPLRPSAAALADPHAGDNNVRGMMDRVHEVFTRHREFFSRSRIRMSFVHGTRARWHCRTGWPLCRAASDIWD